MKLNMPFLFDDFILILFYWFFLIFHFSEIFFFLVFPADATCFRHFKEGDYKSALRQYHFAWLNIKGLGENVMDLTGQGGGGCSVGLCWSFNDRFALLDNSNISEENKSVLKALTESLHLNLAACYLKTEQYSKCISSCSTAIGVNNKSVKAYFRRGQAYLKTKDTDKAER